jgi:hypothetical protein
MEAPSITGYPAIHLIDHRRIWSMHMADLLHLQRRIGLQAYLNAGLDTQEKILQILTLKGNGLGRAKLRNQSIANPERINVQHGQILNYENKSLVPLTNKSHVIQNLLNLLLALVSLGTQIRPGLITIEHGTYRQILHRKRISILNPRRKKPGYRRNALGIQHKIIYRPVWGNLMNLLNNSETGRGLGRANHAANENNTRIMIQVLKI